MADQQLHHRDPAGLGDGLQGHILYQDLAQIDVGGEEGVYPLEVIPADGLPEFAGLIEQLHLEVQKSAGPMSIGIPLRRLTCGAARMMIPESVVVDVSQDWVAASSLQERFMEIPCGRAQRLTFDARCRQMRALGGDCFHFLPLPGRRVGIAVADASGKGLPAALMAANVQSSLRTAAWFAPDDPGIVVSAVNRQLHACSPAERYATLFYGVFDENTRTLHYVNAGHNPTFLIRGGGAVAWLEASGPPVGMFAETVYQAQAVQLHPGDLMLAYTDGFVEAVNTAGQEWGVEGLLEAVDRCRTRQPDGVVEAAFAALDEFSGRDQADDATILAALVH